MASALLQQLGGSLSLPAPGEAGALKTISWSCDRPFVEMLSIAHHDAQDESKIAISSRSCALESPTEAYLHIENRSIPTWNCMLHVVIDQLPLTACWNSERFTHFSGRVDAAISLTFIVVFSLQVSYL